jgi:coenzyme F420-reducing hydrogenase alpha subunit
MAVFKVKDRQKGAEARGQRPEARDQRPEARGARSEHRGRGQREMAFRAYDPCFGYATHANGPLPLLINIYLNLAYTAVV